MKLSDEKIGHLSRAVLDRLLAAEEEDDSVTVMAGDGELRAAIRRVLTDFVRRDDLVHEKVRRKISSLRRPIPEGSAEWNALHDQFLREESGGGRAVR